MMHKARVLAFQMLYSWDFVPESTDELYQNVKGFSNEVFDEGSEAFIKLQVSGTLENIKSIDSLIQEHLNNWKLNRISKIDLAILRLSVYGLLFQKDTDGKVIINEAIILANDFGKEDSFKFINGVLDSIYKQNDKN